jgi:translation initiation factor IF-2
MPGADVRLDQDQEAALLVASLREMIAGQAAEIEGLQARLAQAEASAAQAAARAEAATAAAAAAEAKAKVVPPPPPPAPAGPSADVRSVFHSLPSPGSPCTRSPRSRRSSRRCA